jgi:hypothetical protein
MFKVDDYVTKEGDRFYVDTEEWKKGPETGIEEGDVIKFNFEDKRYIAKVIKFGNEPGLFELINVREVVKIKS